MDNDDSVSEAFVIDMRFQCLKLAHNFDKPAEDIVKDAVTLFKFLVDDIPEDNKEG